MNDSTALTTLTAAPPATMAWPNEAVSLMTLCRDLSHARTLPQWCQKSPADLFFAVQSFLRLRIDPFMGLRHVSIVRNNLFFDGQLCAAMLNNSGRLAGNLTYDYAGDGDDLTVLVRGRLVNETELREVKLRLGDNRTATNENWKSNPDQMLAYKGARVWGRRHCPEVLLGIRFQDEAEMIDITPRSAAGNPSVPATPYRDERSGETEGVGAETVAQEAAQPFSVPRADNDAQAWSTWATTLMAYIRAAPTADSVNDWLTANASHLEELMRFDSSKYRRLVDMIKHQTATKDEVG